MTSLFENSIHAAAYMTGEITHICRDMAKRSPGSEGEREAARYLAGILRRECGCKDVLTEAFRVHPAAFYGYFWFSAVFDSLCVLMFFVRPWFSLVFGGIALLLFLFHFVFYKQILDPVFPEKESVNVTALRPCAGTLRRRVFLNGHTDAAWEFPLNYRFGGIVFEIPGVMSLVGVLFYIALAVCTLFGAGTWTDLAARWGLLFLPFFLLLAFTYDPRRTVDGANDNLSACLMGIAVLREMERLGVQLEGTEVGVILTGAEEAGTRGAKAWCKAHAGDYSDVPTYIVSFDTIHDPRQLMVNFRDLNGTVKADRALGDAFLRAAEKAQVPCKRGLVPLMGGATDSAAFTQGGFRSVAVTGLNHKLEDYYHTRKDSCDNLDAEGLENCYKATVTMLREIDSGALDQS